ncbi:Txe/YoeB family addiction module toxin [Pedobacter alpinus]|uniref:Putative mRNA interferase YoeB n=1 Tax=Pedobacter alpinus TaxID=1590643 RepID=A0ABW5TQ44_9SPHI
MGKFRVTISANAKKDVIQHYKSGNKSNIKKIEIILLELSEHPTTGVSQPEQLRHNLQGFWSRRINKKNRMIYSIN